MKRTLTISLKTLTILGLLYLFAINEPAFAATFTVTNVNDSGPGSLRQAMLDADSNGAIDVINFSIGTGVQTISPLSPLPIIHERLTIDGT